MAMVNGKIVGAKAKKIKKTLKRSKPLVETVNEAKAKAKAEAPEIKKPKKKKAKEEVKSKDKKETRKETSDQEIFRVPIGPHSFLSVDLADDDKGNQVVAVRKWYNTQKDPEIKQGRGGFNIQPKSSELKLLAARLRDIARAIDESKD